MELRDQFNAYRKRCVYLHGCPRFFPGNDKDIQLSSLGVDTKYHICHFSGVLDVSILLISPCHPTVCALFSYFRHYLNLVMLYSVYKDFDLVPCVSLSLIRTLSC
jgi:hypothetical protein